jgi:hypothetical protein
MEKEELKKLIWEGIAKDVFMAEKSFHLFKSIGELYSEIDKKRMSGIFFKSAQDAFKDQFIMAISRLYDAPLKKYKTSCILLVLKFLSDNSKRLSFGGERRHLVIAMKEAGFDEYDVELAFNGTNDQKVSRIVADYFYEQLNNPETKLLIKALKTIRDKGIGHREFIEEKEDAWADIGVVTYKELFSLIEIPKNLIGILGWAYIDSAFSLDGKYSLTDDAKSASRSMQYLIQNFAWKE